MVISKKNITEQENSIGALLRAPFEALADQVYTRLAQEGFEELRQSHGVVLRYITPEGSRITQLARRAQMTKQSMSYLVDYLIEYGYVQMREDPTDGRAKRVILTERGRAAQQAALQISRQVEQSWAEVIGAEEMQRLRRILEQLSVYLRNNERR